MTKIVTVEVRVEVTPTATIAKPSEPSPTAQPTLELAASIVRSGKGKSGGQIDLPAGVYQIHLSVTENDRRFAPDRYELTVISRSGGNPPIVIKGSDSSARESVRYFNLEDDLLYYEVDVDEDGSWQIEIVQTREALPTPTPSPTTPAPTSTQGADPTPEASPTATATPTMTPTPTPSPVPVQDYVVQPGDTLSAIADRFGLTVNELLDANAIEDPNSIQVGAILLIPPAQAGGANSPSLSPTQTQVCPTTDQQAYFQQIGSLFLRWHESGTRMVTLIALTADDQFILLDADWRLSMAGVLIELDNIAFDIEALVPAPGVDELQPNLRSLSSHLHAITQNLAQGLDNLDDVAIETAASHMQEATRIAETLTEQLETFCE